MVTVIQTIPIETPQRKRERVLHRFARLLVEDRRHIAEQRIAFTSSARDAARKITAEILAGTAPETVFEAEQHRSLLAAEKVTRRGKTARILRGFGIGTLVAVAYELLVRVAGGMQGVGILDGPVVMPLVGAVMGGRTYEKAVEKLIDALALRGERILQKLEPPRKLEPPPVSEPPASAVRVDNAGPTE